MTDARTIKQRMIAFHSAQHSHYRALIADFHEMAFREGPESAKAFMDRYDTAPGEAAPERDQTVLGVLRDKMNFHAAALDFLIA